MMQTLIDVALGFVVGGAVVACLVFLAFAGMRW